MSPTAWCPIPGRFFSCVTLLFMISLWLISSVNADCECGYSSTINSTTFIFTDLIESDFPHLGNITLNTDWLWQNYTRSAAESRGNYGESSSLTQIVSNPLQDKHSYSGPGEFGGDTGLQLFVRGGIPTDGLIRISEVDSVRTDLLWGSYRASIKLTDIPGTCGAFFWYFNDSQEIDMEFLSSEFNVTTRSFPVNLVLQSPQSAALGFASGNNFIKAYLPFDPTVGFHEYRIDFVPSIINFYADGQILATMESNTAPTDPGHLILTHWSNGNPGWSSGPPNQDAVMTVSYVKSYFNSSLISRQQDFAIRCENPSIPSAVCVIPDQTTAPDPDGQNGNSTANTYFFSNVANTTNNQTVYHESAADQKYSTWPRPSVPLLVMILIKAAIRF